MEGKDICEAEDWVIVYKELEDKLMEMLKEGIVLQKKRTPRRIRLIQQSYRERNHYPISIIQPESRPRIAIWKIMLFCIYSEGRARKETSISEV